MKKFLLSVAVLSLIPFANANVLAYEDDTDNSAAEEVQNDIRLSIGISNDDAQILAIQGIFGATSEQVENAVYSDSELLNKYLNDDSDASTSIMSSARVEFRNPGYGINVTIVTPENITTVTESMYQNAAIAAGATNADIQIASVVPVTGEGALAGVYEIFSQAGIELDGEDIQNAERQIQIEQILIEQSNLDEKQISLLIATLNLNIVNELEAKGELSEADIQEIIDNTLNEFGYDLTDEAKGLLLEHGVSFSQSDVAKDPETKKALEQTIENFAQLEEAFNNTFDVGYGVFKIDDIQIIPSGAENNYEGVPVLAIYFTFTLNEDSKPRSANQAWTDSVKIIQDNNENYLNDLFAQGADYYEEEYTQSGNSDLKPGGSASYLVSYKLDDVETPILLEFYNNAWDDMQKPVGELVLDLKLLN